MKKNKKKNRGLAVAARSQPPKLANEEAAIIFAQPATNPKQPNPQSIFARIQGWLALLVAAVGGAATLAGATQIFDLFDNLSPKFENKSLNQATGYELSPFLIKNPSNWFNMYDARVVCFVYSAGFKDRATGAQFGEAYEFNYADFDARSSHPQTIVDGRHLSFSCDLKARGLDKPNADVLRVRQQIAVKYSLKILGLTLLEREACSPEYLGFSTDRSFEWVEGILVTARKVPEKPTKGSHDIPTGMNNVQSEPTTTKSLSWVARFWPKRANVPCS